MKVKLKDIAVVSSGITFRSRLQPLAAGNLRIVQMKDLGDDNRVHVGDVMRVEYKMPKRSHFIQVGDLVFRSRGQTTTAAILNADCDNAVVAAPLLRIQVRRERVLPEYLLWYLNHPVAQAYFFSCSEGTAIKMITLKTLESMELDLPPMETQSVIVRLFNLSMTEQHLLESIKQQREKYIQELLFQMASNKPETKRKA